jgi:hypothetical protein
MTYVRSVLYCNMPLTNNTIAANIGYQWYISSTSNFGYSMYNKSLGSAQITYYKQVHSTKANTYITTNKMYSGTNGS